MRGQKNQCFAARFESDSTFLSCALSCEGYEREAINSIGVDGELPGSRQSDLETSDLGPNFCALWSDFNGEEICTDGSVAASEFKSEFAKYDYEIAEEYGCVTRACEDGKCVLKPKAEESACILSKTDSNNNPINAAGTCSVGTCIITSDSECPDGMGAILYDAPDCSKFDYVRETAAALDTNDNSAFFINNLCDIVSVVGADNQCRTFGPQVNSVMCTTSSYVGPDFPNANDYFDPVYMNTQDQSNAVNFAPHGVTWSQTGTCILGKADGYNCVITGNGVYEYRQMEITYYAQPPLGDDTVGRTQQTIMYIETTTRFITQVAVCPAGKKCHGTIFCQWYATSSQQYPCGKDRRGCSDTLAPTTDPAEREERATSHGDPIIWTFNDECYDLNRDGKYAATHHEKYRHHVNIGIYNDYMREIEVVDNDGNVLLYINSDGEFWGDDYPFTFEHFEKQCPESFEENECKDTYMGFQFDAQEFQYNVQILRHDYNDPGLKEGEIGFHLDIYPVPYDDFYLPGHKELYSGLYFENPLPDELEYCQGGSIRS